MTRILAITPGDGRDLSPWIDALDVDAILFREPGASVAHWVDRARERGLATHVHSRCADRPMADFMHLRADEPPVNRPFGVSCHDETELALAFGRGASYALLSPVFPPTSKPDDRRPTLGRRGFATLAGEQPVYALGGLCAETAFACYGLAVLGWFFEVSPAEAALRSEALRRRLATLDQKA